MQQEFDKGRNPGRKAFVLGLYFFLLVAAYYQVKPLSRTLFITALGSQNLPYLWIGTTVVLSILLPIYHWRLRYCSPWSVLFWSNVSFLLLLGLFRLPLGEYSKWEAIGFYLLVDVFSVVLVENFWSLTNSSFRESDGKRWYGLVASGGLLGGMVGSSIASRLLDVSGWKAVDLIFVAIAILIVSIVLVHSIFRSGHVNTTFASLPGEGVFRRGFAAAFLHHRYLRLVVYLLLLAQLIEPIVEYQFLSMVESALPDLKGRTQYLSSVFAMLSTVALMTNILALPLLHHLFGTVGGLVLQPAAIFAMSSAFLWTPALGTASTLKIFDRGLAYSAGRASRELLYLRFDPMTIYLVKGWVDVYGYRMFKILGALTILLLTSWLPWKLSLHQFAYLTLAIATYWFYVVFCVHRYVRESASELDRDPIDLSMVESLTSTNLQSQRDSE